MDALAGKPAAAGNGSAFGLHLAAPSRAQCGFGVRCDEAAMNPMLESCSRMTSNFLFSLVSA